MKTLIPLFLLAAVLVSPAVFSQKDAGSSARATREDDGREVVFRYEFKVLARAADFYFIGIDNKNPSDEFLARFRNDVPIVRPISDARHEKKPLATIVDKRTEKDGIIFRTGAIRWTSETHADVEGGYECGDLCDATTGTYGVTRQGDHWVVDSFTPSATSGKS
jgi:hypothetical protein